jgi:hypothetical protein
MTGRPPRLLLPSKPKPSRPVEVKKARSITAAGFFNEP